MAVNLICRTEAFRINGACFEVYRQMGCGFLEAVYQECLEVEFGCRDIPFRAQQVLSLEYKGRKLRSSYVPDFVCFESIVVELKAVTSLSDEHRAQVQNYLRATGLKLGLLVNFGHYPKAQIERIVATYGRYGPPKAAGPL